MNQFVLIILIIKFFVGGVEYFVATDGTPEGDGSIDNPWDFYTCVRVKGDGFIKPGTQIWVRGGTYRGRYTSKLTGNSTHPIIIRNYQNERAIIDGGDQEGYYPLYVNRRYTWYWGLEFMLSGLGVRTRNSDTSCIYEEPAPDPEGGIKYINCILHDSGSCGIKSYDGSYMGTEIYGNIIYYQGEHGLYLQNGQNGVTKIVDDNIIFKQLYCGFHMYTQDAYLDNVEANGNVIFENSPLTQEIKGYNLIWGGTENPSNNCKLKDNYVYFREDFPHASVNFGYHTTLNNFEVTNNYFVGETIMNNGCNNCSIHGNVFYGEITGFEESEYPDNTYHGSSMRPTENMIVVRKNKYEDKRGHVIVYNWEDLLQVSVDISSLGFSAGDCYSVIDVENYFGDPVAHGQFSGEEVSVTMTSTAVTPIVGTIDGDINHTPIEFGCFVVTGQCHYNDDIDGDDENGQISSLNCIQLLNVVLYFLIML